MKPIAFFCAEYAIEDNLNLYAGGLGILAGDMVRQAGDEKVPLVAIGLFYSGGFESAHTLQKISDDHVLMFHGFQRVLNASGKPLLLEVDAGSRTIHVQVWTRAYGTAELYLLDTNVENNTPEDRAIMTHLYDSNYSAELKQEFILGIGGVKLLRALKITPGIYHLNEGHTSFVALALAAEYLHDHPQESSFMKALDAVRPLIVSTKHTILAGAGLFIEKETLRALTDSYTRRHRIDFEELFAVGSTNEQPTLFSTTRFLLRSSIRSNGVSMLHTIFERQQHSQSTLFPITNGVYTPRWLANEWPREGAAVLTDVELWKIRTALRTRMVDFVAGEVGVNLNPNALTIVWARRFASYKRPYILFSDLARLEKLVSDKNQPVQIIISGMAHESDKVGAELVKKIEEHVSREPFLGKVVYIPTYSLSVARKLVSGADVWLNTPERGIEACGTSGMKAGLNGALEFSTSDGWIEEVEWNETGWILPNERAEETMYLTIEQSIKPLFYEQNGEGVPEQWVKRVRKTMNIINRRFTARRMLHDYISQLYYPNSKE